MSFLIKSRGISRPKIAAIPSPNQVLETAIFTGVARAFILQINCQVQSQSKCCIAHAACQSGHAVESSG